jgi:hypothetical protein
MSLAEGTQPAWLLVQQDKLMGSIQNQHLSQEVVGIHQDSSAVLAHMPQHDADFHLEIPIILLGDVAKTSVRLIPSLYHTGASLRLGHFLSGR